MMIHFVLSYRIKVAISIGLDAVVQVREVPRTATITTLHPCGRLGCCRTTCQEYHSEEEHGYWKFCLVEKMCRNSYRVSKQHHAVMVMKFYHYFLQSADETFESFCEKHTYPENIATSSLNGILKSGELSEDTYKPSFRLLLYLDELENSKRMISE